MTKEQKREGQEERKEGEITNGEEQKKERTWTPYEFVSQKRKGKGTYAARLVPEVARGPAEDIRLFRYDLYTARKKLLWATSTRKQNDLDADILDARLKIAKINAGEIVHADQHIEIYEV